MNRKKVSELINSRLSPEKKGLPIPEANISCQDLKPDQVIGILGHPELSFLGHFTLSPTARKEI